MNWNRKSFLVLCPFISLFLLCSSAHANIFACKDKGGTVRFTNVPADPSCAEYTLGIETVQKTTSWTLPVTENMSSYDRHIYNTATRYNIDPLLIKAIIRTESSFNERARSSKGAQGLMQLMPSTQRDLQVRNPFNAHENIEGGTKYFRYLMDIFDENLVLSLAAYNAGPAAVKQAGGVPHIPETKQYVATVLKNYRNYRKQG